MEQKLVINKKNLYNKFLNFFIKKGKKVKIKSILDLTFFKMSQRYIYPINTLLLKTFVKLNSFLEIKNVKKNRRARLIPFSIGLSRRSYIALKWVKKAINSDKRKLSFSDKLNAEITNLNFKPKQSNALILKNSNTKQALANRANIHFRW
jgi:ribosomal protein S7